MKKRLTYVSPLQLGIVHAVLYGILTLIIVPFLIIGMLISGRGLAAICLIFIPVAYAIAGFIAGVIVAFIYNLVAKWTGGIEFVLTDVP